MNQWRGTASVPAAQSGRRRWLVVWLLAAGGATGSVAAGEVPLDVRASRAITSPIYGPAGGTPVAIVRVESTRTEYLRRGFLRIGALPVLVAERVRLEVRDAKATVAQLGQLPEWLRAPGKGRAGELRDFQMFDRAEPGRPWLSASRVRFASNGQWELAGVEVRGPGLIPVTAGHALLQVTGDRAGQVLLSDGRVLPLLAPPLSSAPLFESAAFRPENGQSKPMSVLAAPQSQRSLANKLP